jgi:DNA-binding XRE family transcriptional regulator
MHLRAMRARALQRRTKRIDSGLCTSCGVRPGFWGRLCVACRDSRGFKPLPRAALAALRLHRKTETEQRLQEVKVLTSRAAEALLTSGRVHGRAAEALAFYVGFDNREWRSYRQIGELMEITAERVRQLLLPSKVILASILSDVPWLPAESTEVPKSSDLYPCRHITQIVRDGQPIKYDNSDLDVWLLGLNIPSCQSCGSFAPNIPEVAELNKIIAANILLQKRAVTGGELRFLRRLAGLGPTALAESLGLSRLTIINWETLERIKVVNDIAIRVVLGRHIFGATFRPSLVSRTEERTNNGRITIRWLSSAAQWSAVNESDPGLPTKSRAVSQRNRANSPPRDVGLSPM